MATEPTLGAVFYAQTAVEEAIAQAPAELTERMSVSLDGAMVLC